MMSASKYHSKQNKDIKTMQIMKDMYNFGKPWYNSYIDPPLHEIWHSIKTKFSNHKRLFFEALISTDHSLNCFIS